MDAVEAAFPRLTPDAVRAADALTRFRAQMAVPPRVYHTEAHVEAVLVCLDVWTGGDPSLPLVAAALYHDALYDATRHDNEAQSATFAALELTRLGVSSEDIATAANLVRATQQHQPDPGDRDAVLLIDADLYILGSDASTYAAYVAAIRAEYAHVPDDAWRTGRRAVMDRFLQRLQIYSGDWQGRDAHEARARKNIAAEIASLELPIPFSEQP